MKFQGKIAIWFWLLIIAGNAVFLHELLFGEDPIGALIMGAVIFNLVCFGFLIASTAASLDRISIRGRRSELMCAVKNRKRFFEELKKKNPNIKMYI